MKELFENAQLLLSGRQEWRRRSDNLFIGLLPPRETAELFSGLGGALRRHHFRRGRLRPTHHLHLTLFHVGNFAGLPAGKVAAAKRACAAAACLSQAFAVQMHQAACWKKEKGNVPLVLSIRGRNLKLDQLYQRVVIQCAREWLKSGKVRFNPHVTLAYLDEGFGTEAIAPVTWVTEELVLIHSLMGQTRYIELGRWKLGGRDE